MRSGSVSVGCCFWASCSEPLDRSPYRLKVSLLIVTAGGPAALHHWFVKATFAQIQLNNVRKGDIEV